jgi:hypothetical protein
MPLGRSNRRFVATPGALEVATLAAVLGVDAVDVVAAHAADELELEVLVVVVAAPDELDALPLAHATSKAGAAATQATFKA